MRVVTYPHPTHLNGTGLKGLSDQHRAVMDALRAAIDAVIDATPHGRDWQAADHEDYVRARQCSLYRLEALQDIFDDVLEGYISLNRDPA